MYVTETADTPEMVDAPVVSYLYVERDSPMEPAAIKAAMGSAMRAVSDYMQTAAIKPAGPSIAVYPEFDEKQVKFRAGFVIAPEDAVKSDDNVMADVTPAGSVLHTTHVGPYERLGETYDHIVKHLGHIGRVMKLPSWELYPNDQSVTPAEELRTEIYMPTDKA